MNLSYLIQILQNKITMLNNAKSQAFASGDINQVAQIDQELLDTQNTFAQLTMLADVTQTALATNTSTAELFASGVETALRASVQGPSASAVINGYDISAYATDPLYEQKILTILAAMPVFTSLEEVDAYIQETAPGSPVTAAMIQAAVDTYSVDTSLLIAIMQNDSSFGTAGVGARTKNPGNVGNTGYAEQSFATWEEGVAAVAEWLSRHVQPA
jgi:hypothetical protein